MNDDDWVFDMFPGDGLQLPSDKERDRADEILATWDGRWHESHPPVPRTHPQKTDEGFANPLAGVPTNRSYMRAYLRRWWRKP